jgi:hypothetical protein
MGLDISHYKIIDGAVDEYPPGLTYAVKDNFGGYDVNDEYFRKYWTLIKIYKRLSSTKYVINKNEFEPTRQIWQEWNSKVHVELITKEKLRSLLNEKNAEVKPNKIYFLKNESNWFSLNLFEYRTTEGFYLKQVGYQRKGVKDEFFQHFDINKKGITRYTQKEKFELVYELIGKYYEHDTDEDIIQLRTQYKKDFIGKYEEGKSILSISY